MLMPGPLWACLALMWVRSCSAHSLFTCEPIKVHRCLGMTYNMTFFPNMMDHYDQDIAATNMEVSPHSTSHMSWLIQFIVPVLTLSSFSRWILPMQFFFFFCLSLSKREPTNSLWNMQAHFTKQIPSALGMRSRCQQCLKIRQRLFPCTERRHLKKINK